MLIERAAVDTNDDLSNTLKRLANERAQERAAEIAHLQWALRHPIAAVKEAFELLYAELRQAPPPRHAKNQVLQRFAVRYWTAESRVALVQILRRILRWFGLVVAGTIVYAEFSGEHPRDAFAVAVVVGLLASVAGPPLVRGVKSLVEIGPTLVRFSALFAALAVVLWFAFRLPATLIALALCAIVALMVVRLREPD